MRNAVHAGVVTDAADYAFSSSSAYAHGGGPEWLCRDWAEGVVAAAFGVGGFTGERYRELFHARFDERCYQFVDERTRCQRKGPDPTDSLLAGAAPAVLRWMREKARLADGTRPGLPLVPSGVITECLAAVPHEPCLQNARQMIRVKSLLLREFAGLTFAQIAAVTRRSREAARLDLAASRKAMAEDPVLAEAIATLGHAALATFYGSPLPGGQAAAAGRLVV